MNILMVCKGEWRYISPEIAAVLRRDHACEVHALAFNTPMRHDLERRGVFSKIYDLAEHLRRFDDEHGIEDALRLLEDLEGMEDVPPLSLLIQSDRVLRKRPYERAVKLLAGAYHFWQELYAHARPDAVFGELASAVEWLGVILGDRDGVRQLIPYPTPVADRFYFIDGPQGMWKEMEREYLALRDGELPAERARAAEAWWQAFHKAKLKPAFLKLGTRWPFRFQPAKFVRRLGRVPFRVKAYLQNGVYEVGTHHGTSPLASVWANVLSMYHDVMARAFAFQKKVCGGRYVYFPLHVQPEYTTDVRAPYYANQVALIENIARSLPIGYRLVVKEHPGMRGERPLRYYRDIARIFNVQLLSPSVDSHDLIRNAAAVTTITGTTAWEAILYQKPVITFGTVCYGFYDLVYHCPDVQNFPAVLRQALTSFNPDKDLLLKFVSALLETAHRGTICDPTHSAAVLTPENLANLARAIVVQMEQGAEPVPSLG